MNKGELIDAVASSSDLTKTDASSAVNAVFAVIEKSMKKGDDVSLPGFGKFSVTKRAARMGVNPATGEKIKIKAKKVVKFKAGKGLADAVN